MNTERYQNCVRCGEQLDVTDHLVAWVRTPANGFAHWSCTTDADGFVPEYKRCCVCGGQINVTDGTGFSYVRGAHCHEGCLGEVATCDNCGERDMDTIEADDGRTYCRECDESLFAYDNYNRKVRIV